MLFARRTIAKEGDSQFSNLVAIKRECNFVILYNAFDGCKEKANGVRRGSKAWFNHAMLALTGHESQSEREAHVMICTVDDMADHLGLWIRDVTSHYMKKDGGPFVTMRLMIPWQFVLSVGLVDDKVKIPTGFQNTTVLTAQSE